MIAHQLDLFGGPLKPPKKIKIDDELPEESPSQVVTEEPATEPEFAPDIQADNHFESTPDPVSNNAEWIKEEEDTGSRADHFPGEQNEEMIAATEPHNEASFTNEDIADYEEEPGDLNFTDTAIFSEGNEDTVAAVAEEQSEDEIPDYNDSDIVAETAVSAEPVIEEPVSTRERKQPTQESDYEIDGLNIPPDEQLFKRQYYSMRETSAMFGVNQSLLRFWENEFDILQPKKNKKGDRYFRPVDIKNLVLIYHLLRVRKFTMDGAKDYLHKHKNAGDTFVLIQRLEKLKSFLLELKAGL